MPSMASLRGIALLLGVVAACCLAPRAEGAQLSQKTEYAKMRVEVSAVGEMIVENLPSRPTNMVRSRSVGNEDSNASLAEQAGLVMQGWNSHEHMNLGDVAFLQFFDEAKEQGEAWDDNVEALLDTFNNKDDQAKYLDNRDPLHFGDFVALSGDYYADMHRRDVDGVKRYKGPGVQDDIESWALGKYQENENRWTSGGVFSFNTLYQDLDSGMRNLQSTRNIQNLLLYLRSNAHTKAPSNSQVKLIHYFPNYLLVAAENYDHFGKTAALEYSKAHDAARRYAFQAGQLKRTDADPACKHDWNGHCTWGHCYQYRKATCKGGWIGWSYKKVCKCGVKYGKRMCSVGGVQCRPSPRAWTGQLQRAVELLAMGMHYYTDRFSSGHLRVPYSGGDAGDVTMVGKCGECMGDKTRACPALLGFTVKCMHGEDNDVGVHVNNSLGNKWIMYGDGMWFERKDKSDPNKPNREIAYRGVKAALNDFWAAFKDGVAGRKLSGSALDTGGARDPFAYFGSPTDKAFPPMIKVENGKILFRETAAKVDPAKYVDFQCPSFVSMHHSQCSTMGKRQDLPANVQWEDDDMPSKK